MTDSPNAATGGAAPAAQPAAPGPGKLPPVQVEAQYLKDLSFENPQGLPALLAMRDSPAVAIECNASVSQLAENRYEVCLVLHVKATAGETTLFIIETTYAGVFRLNNIPQESVRPVLLIEAPRLLFPFVRSIVAEAARDGGFPPLLINPIDFAALYQQQHVPAPAGAAGS